MNCMPSEKDRYRAWKQIDPLSQVLHVTRANTDSVKFNAQDAVQHLQQKWYKLTLETAMK